MSRVTLVIIEIAVLFALGGVYYLFQRRRYIKMHEKVTQDFIKQISKLSKESWPQESLAFEKFFIKRYREDQSLKRYETDEQLLEVCSEYLSYLESISGPLL